MSETDVPSEVSTDTRTEASPRASQSGQRVLYVMALLAGVSLFAVVYLVFMWFTIDGAMKRLNTIREVCKDVLDSEVNRANRQGRNVTGQWSWDCNFESGGKYSLSIFDPSARRTPWADVRITTKHKQPIAFENRGGSGTPTVIAALKAELANAGISVD